MNHAAGDARPAAVRLHEARREPLTAPQYEGLVTRGIAFAIDAAMIDLVAIVVAGGVALALTVLSLPEDSLDALLIAAGSALVPRLVDRLLRDLLVDHGADAGLPPDEDHGLQRRRRQHPQTSPSGPPVCRMVVAAIPVLAGFLPILFDDRRRGLHDMLAGTVAVAAPELSRGSGPSPPRTPRR